MNAIGCEPPEPEERGSWVLEFACPHGPGEAVIVEGVTRVEALDIQDGLGCVAWRVRPLAEVRLLSDPWTHDGFLRCSPEPDPDLLSLDYEKD
jgi:hypothetical protein